MERVHDMWQRICSRHPRWARLAQHGVAPALIYFAAFCLLTYSLISRFEAVVFGDRTDGLQNVWNIWWVNLVLRHPNQYASIWYTNLLHWPYGTTLIGHTLNPFNSYLGAVLLTFFSLKAAYNTIVVFTFVTGGVTMYWLAYYLTKSYWASLMAGFLFTFSSYHFTHAAAGQLQVMSLECIPLFLLCWHVLLRRPGILIALGAAAALWLLLLCDYYYFVYCIMAAALMLLWYAASWKSLRNFTQREALIGLGTFAGATILLCGPMVFSLLVSNLRDPLTGAHDSATYSLDLLGLVVPRRIWLFSQWTQAYWSRVPPNVVEGNVYLAIPVYFLVAYAWVRRKAVDHELRQQIGLWLLIAGLFFLLALGPVLHVAGSAVWDALMPYTLLGRVFPLLSLSGVPARMAVMVILAACILSAIGLRELFTEWPKRRLLTVVLLALLLFQSLPAPLPVTAAPIPDYVTALRDLPDDGGVVDQVRENPSLQLYYQTVHGKPIAFGYISRVPSSVLKDDQGLSAAIAAQDYAKLLFTYRIRYIVTEDTVSVPSGQTWLTAEVVYDKRGVRIYRLGCTCEGQ